MKIDLDELRVASGKKIDLRQWPTEIAPLYNSIDQYRELLAADVETLSGLQRRLYASDSHAVLLIFQGMDAAGKDGAIGHVLTGINPEGCEVHAFKQPSATELAHDFLWRASQPLPGRGRIGVYNRSYYEEVLIARVHPEAILAQEGEPDSKRRAAVWEGRYRSIVDFEQHLHRNRTTVVKVFLHLSKKVQRKRFLERFDQPDKTWKISPSDLSERAFWKDYRKAYEACLAATSTGHAPWHVVPADDRENARLIVSRVVVDALERLDLKFPKPTAQRRRELQRLRKQLESE